MVLLLPEPVRRGAEHLDLSGLHGVSRHAAGAESRGDPEGGRGRAADRLRNCAFQQVRPQELLLSRPGQKLPDQPVRPPVLPGGKLRIGGTGFSRRAASGEVVGITRIHLEEDPAKLNHTGGATGADYNRSGVPLLETVSEPDMRSADEAYAYLTRLKEIMQYGGISDCDMEKGADAVRCEYLAAPGRAAGVRHQDRA